eukprot:CAMPEP_0171565424 /NCGR_PEP_ID=MMETSP0960-20121227/16865_1 /TAXON_ID=87120 /ORGANISM="Aurantiochytrium limacinum, Strain ATCCMYA-1381" /LENGTH=55 /DNA_ID=CAMNT_0012118975 /DNA_START=358 /DNA_END=522 /DNA_ORIENTATION=+
MSPFAARQHLSAQALAGHTKLDLHVGKAQRELNAEARRLLVVMKLSWLRQNKSGS